MISGWAVDPNAVYRYQVDAAFPLSDHADYTDLLRYVELVQPKRVLTLHGFAAEFARDLRERGIEAWALSAAESDRTDARQRLSSRDRCCEIPAPKRNRQQHGSRIRSFATFAEVGEAIAATPAKLEKIRLLAEYLRIARTGTTADRDHLLHRKAVSTKRSANAAGRLVGDLPRAHRREQNEPKPEFRRIASSHGDAGKTAFEALEGRTAPEPFTFGESRRVFRAICTKRAARWPKRNCSKTASRKLSALEGAICRQNPDRRSAHRSCAKDWWKKRSRSAFDAPLDEVKEANMLLGDIGANRVACLATANWTAPSFRFFARSKACSRVRSRPRRRSGRRFAVAGRCRTTSDRPFTSKTSSTAFARNCIAAADASGNFLARPAADHRSVPRDGRAGARTFDDELILDGEIMAFEHGQEADIFRSAKTARPKKRRSGFVRGAFRRCAGRFCRLRFALAERPIAPARRRCGNGANCCAA